MPGGGCGGSAAASGVERQIRQARQRDRPPARLAGPQIVHLGGLQALRQARAQQLLAPVARQRQRHQLLEQQVSAGRQGSGRWRSIRNSGGRATPKPAIGGVDPACVRLEQGRSAGRDRPGPPRRGGPGPACAGSDRSAVLLRPAPPPAGPGRARRSNSICHSRSWPCRKPRAKIGVGARSPPRRGMASGVAHDADGRPRPAMAIGRVARQRRGQGEPDGAGREHEAAGPGRGRGGPANGASRARR